MKSMIDVLFLTNIPSPYMVGFLNELGKYCNLTVIFEKQSDSTRPNSWKETLGHELRFKSKILKGIPIGSQLYGDNLGIAPDDKAFSLSVIKHLKRKYDLIIVSNPCTPTGIIAIIYLQIMRIPYAIQSEGGFPGSGKGLKEYLKYRLMSKAVLYFSTCNLDDQYFYRYGATDYRIRRYNFTSMYKKDMPSEVISENSKNDIKKKLSIPDGIMIMTVGRSVPIKGYDILLKAYSGVERYIKSTNSLENVTLYFIGAEKLPEYDEIIRRYSIKNVEFIRNIPFEQLKEYYKAADIFVMPTRRDTWGLVINEAMAYGLPIISTNMCVATDALIEDKVNGLIIDSEDVEGMRNAIISLLIDRKKRYEMSNANYKKIHNNTIENMGITMYKHVEEYCSEKRKIL